MGHPTTKHYDQEVAFFEGFLDPYMKYSSGYYLEEGEPLDVGELRMLDMLIDAGNIRNGSRLLDIGNGWGCLVRRLGERGLDVEYTGINPSQVQLDYIDRNIKSGLNVVRAPFEEIMGELEGPFDNVYMLGATCHMHDKLSAFQRISELLADDGRLVLEDTFFLSEELYQKHYKRPETRFVQDKVFGYAHVYSVAHHLDDLRQAGLRMMTALDNTDHYARTAEIWIERLQAMDPEQFPLAKQFVQYMDVFQRGWGHTICNHMMTAEKLPQRRAKQHDIPAD